MFTVCALAGVLGFALSACDDSSSAGGDNGSGGNRGGIPDTVETFMELSDYDCGKSQKCVATYLMEYHDMAVCDGDNGWVIGTLIEKMDCDFSSSSDKSSDSKSNDPAEVTDDSSDSKGNPSSAGTSTKSSNSNTSGNDAKSSSSAGKVESSSSKGEVPKSYAEAKVMPSGTYACSKYKCFTTEYLNQDFLEAGKYGEILDERDGQVYKTIEICDEENENCQIWMAQNLNYAYTNVPYNYGDYTSDSTSWCYDNAPANCFKYGRLYTWAVAIDSVKLASDADNPQDCGFRKDCDLISVGSATLIQGFCPNGWHLPNGDEWNALFTAVGGRNIAGTKLKSTNGWQENGNGDDAFGFSALPAGRRAYSGDFFNDATRTYLWSSIEGESLGAYRVNLDYHSGLADLGSSYKNHGYSVRCLKDSE